MRDQTRLHLSPVCSQRHLAANWRTTAHPWRHSSSKITVSCFAVVLRDNGSFDQSSVAHYTRNTLILSLCPRFARDTVLPWQRAPASDERHQSWVLDYQFFSGLIALPVIINYMYTGCSPDVRESILLKNLAMISRKFKCENLIWRNYCMSSAPEDKTMHPLRPAISVYKQLITHLHFAIKW